MGLWFLVPQDAVASLVPAVVAAAIRDRIDVARCSSVRKLRKLEQVFRSSQSLAHRTPTGTLIRSSPSCEKRERLNERSDPVGPENSLRWGSHSMSNCDGVRTIVIRAGSVHPEGVTYTPHEGSSQPPDTGDQPENWQRVSMFFGSLHQKLRVGGPPTGSVHRDGSVFLCIVTGASVCCERCTSSLATLRRHFLRAVAAAVFFRPCRCGDFGFVSRHKPAEHRIPDVRAAPDVEASCITSCCGRRVPFSDRRCGVTVRLQSRRRQPVLHLSQVSSSGVTSALRVTDDSHHGCAVRMETAFHCLEASQSTTKVTKHSAATAGQLPSGTGRDFPVDQREEFSAPAIG